MENESTFASTSTVPVSIDPIGDLQATWLELRFSPKNGAEVFVLTVAQHRDFLLNWEGEAGVVGLAREYRFDGLPLHVERTTLAYYDEIVRLGVLKVRVGVISPMPEPDEWDVGVLGEFDDVKARAYVTCRVAEKQYPVWNWPDFVFKWSELSGKAGLLKILHCIFDIWR